MLMKTTDRHNLLTNRTLGENSMSSGTATTLLTARSDPNLDSLNQTRSHTFVGKTSDAEKLKNVRAMSVPTATFDYDEVCHAFLRVVVINYNYIISRLPRMYTFKV
jgi:hypothetical protein